MSITITMPKVFHRKTKAHKPKAPKPQAPQTTETENPTKVSFLAALRARTAGFRAGLKRLARKIIAPSFALSLVSTGISLIWTNPANFTGTTKWVWMLLKMRYFGYAATTAATLTTAVVGFVLIVFGVDLFMGWLLGRKPILWTALLAAVSFLGEALGFVAKWVTLVASWAFFAVVGFALLIVVTVLMVAFRLLAAVALTLQTPYMALKAPHLLRRAWGEWLRGWKPGNLYTVARPIFKMHRKEEPANITVPYMEGYEPGVSEPIRTGSKTPQERPEAEQPKGRPTPKQPKRRPAKPHLSTVPQGA